MQMYDLADGVLAFVHPEGRSSCGMVQTTEGVVLIDTTARPVDIEACMDLAHITPADVCLIILTHSHSDHTSGIPLFKCPVLSHRLTRQRIKRRGSGRSKKQMPTEVFENRRELDIGGVNINVIHTGGHTPGSSVVWLHGERILFTGDLIFQGRYPFLATADVARLMDVLCWLPGLDARVIVPGHGSLCDNEAVLNQLQYIKTTWQRTAELIELGHTLEQIVVDPRYTRYSEIFYEQLHEWNIRVIYQQQNKLIGKK